MRFKDLGQKATKSLWDDWKHLIREILNEFNTDVFQGRGVIRESSYKEKAYLLLETKKECLYVFPVPGSALVFSIHQHKIPKEQLKLKSPLIKLDEENPIGAFGIGVRGVNSHHRRVKRIVYAYVKKSLRNIYRQQWIDWLSQSSHTDSW